MIYGVMQPTAGAFFWKGARTVIHKPLRLLALEAESGAQDPAGPARG